MSNKLIFELGARVVVWISQRDDVREGDAGTVVSIRPNYQSADTYYLDVILDTGIRMGNYPVSYTHLTLPTKRIV